MTEYKCFRCCYITKFRSYMVKHFNKKNKCEKDVKSLKYSDEEIFRLSFIPLSEIDKPCVKTNIEFQTIDPLNIRIKKTKEELLEEIKAGKIHWQNNYFNVMIDNEIEQDNFLIRPIEIEEGVLECKKCNSKRVFSYAKQSRSADESTSTFAECVACKYKWVNS